jgi:hypothetical protein
VVALDNVVWPPGMLLTIVTSDVNVVGVAEPGKPVGSDEGNVIALEGGPDTLGTPKRLDCEFVIILKDAGDG